MKKNGFTLIELLAVIVILAIIALIATPIVLNIIEESKESATLRGTEYYIDAVELGVARAKLNNIAVEDGTYNILSNGNICNQNDITNEVCNEGKEITIDVKGEIPDSGTVTITNGKLENEFLKYDNNVITKVDNEFVIVPKPESFETDDWITIIANVNVGNIDKYEVGATKTITLTSTDDDSENEDGFTTGTYTVRIANKSNDGDVCTKEKNSSGETYSKTACGFVIEFVDIITTHVMNETNTDVGGWPGSELYEFVTEDIYNAIPNEIRRNIIDTKVVSGAESKDKSNYVTIDKLYLLATREVFKIEDDTAGDDSLTGIIRQLDYYEGKNVGTSSANYEYTKKQLNGGQETWWLRAVSSEENSAGFWAVYKSDTIMLCRSNSNIYHGVAPAFRLG